MAEQTETPEKVEAVKNCAGCKKIISRARRYYRDGAYYCNKNCYKKKMAGTVNEDSEGKEEAGGGKDKKESKGEAKEEAKTENKAEAKTEKTEAKAEKTEAKAEKSEAKSEPPDDSKDSKEKS